MGPRTGTLTITDDDSSSPQSVTLSGVGTRLSLTPTLLNFGTTLVGVSTKAAPVTIKNTSNATIVINGVTASTDYTQSHAACPSNLGPQQSCTMTVKLTPSAPGVRYGTISISSNDGASPSIVEATGIGTYLSGSASKLNFGQEPIGISSRPQNFMLTNNGPNPLNITGVGIQGTLYQTIFDYTQKNNCGNTLASGASCTFSVTFNPTGTGSRAGTLVIQNSEAQTSPLVVNLSGTGTAGAQRH